MALIEIYQTECGRWAFRMISAAGRALVTREGFPCDWSAIICARDYRVQFNRIACAIDDRMGATV